jgi:hypothetical protein
MTTSSEEQKTFNKLRRPPLQEMVEILQNIKLPPPMFSLGGSVCERKDYFSEVNFYLERIKLLKDNGWDPEEFYLELEKRSIFEIVREYNQSVEFPTEILERVKRIFPDAVFTKAEIKLE